MGRRACAETPRGVKKRPLRWTVRGNPLEKGQKSFSYSMDVGIAPPNLDEFRSVWWGIKKKFTCDYMLCVLDEIRPNWELPFLSLSGGHLNE